MRKKIKCTDIVTVKLTGEQIMKLAGVIEYLHMTGRLTSIEIEYLLPVLREVQKAQKSFMSMTSDKG